MSVAAMADGSIRLAGVCPSEDAESLLRLVADRPNLTIDWRECENAHAAVVQVLLAAKPAMRGPPAGEFLRTHIEFLLSGGRGGASLAPASVPKKP